MDELRVGILGLGFMGGMHARLFSQMPGVRVVAVADTLPERRETVAAALGADAYESFQRVLEREDVDAVSICLPDAAHRVPAVMAAERGKHILLEKPIATTLKDAAAIAEAVQRSGVVTMIGFLLRYEPRYASIKAALEDGTIGDIVHMYTRRNSPRSHGPRRYGSAGNLTYHVAVHDLDLLHWYSRAPVERVYAERARRVLTGLGLDDSIFATLRFADGSIACLEYSWVLPETSPTAIDAKLEVIGSRSAAYVDLADQGLALVGPAGTAFADVSHWPSILGSLGGALKTELEAFVRCVKRVEQPRAGVAEGIAALRLAIAIERSLNEQRVVAMSEIPEDTEGD
ncbi:MAG TPA: Gfo/Idh/MocA family oxidoreductase [Firmicutes bacterium]|nr:Gfo/Idh/MocA family oxidoreductase [Bacillota bacterium]